MILTMRKNLIQQRLDKILANSYKNKLCNKREKVKEARAKRAEDLEALEGGPMYGLSIATCSCAKFSGAATKEGVKLCSPK